MNITRAFAEYLATITASTIGQDLFIGQAPSSDKAPDSIWWVSGSGGDVTTRVKSGENLKSYLIEVHYRNRNYQTVYENMQSLEERLNDDPCTQLNGFDTVDIEATTFPVDDDLDAEDRKVGLLQATITIYKEN